MIKTLQSEIRTLKEQAQKASRIVSSSPKSIPAASTNTDRIVSNLRDENEMLRELVAQLRGDLDLAVQLSQPTEKAAPKPRGHNYFIIDDCDAAMSAEVKRVEECLRAILHSEEVEFSDVVELNQFFKEDSGRRKFTQMLEELMQEFSSLTLSTNSFELLLYLINTTLTEMDTSDSSDLITAKILMRASSVVKRDTDEGDQYIKAYIASYTVYHDFRFWEELFWEELFRSHKHRSVASGMEEDDVYQLDHSLTIQVVKDLIVVMLHWKCFRDEVQRFIAHIFKQTKTPDEFTEDFRTLTAQDSFWTKASSSKVRHGTWTAKRLKKAKTASTASPRKKRETRAVDRKPTSSEPKTLPDKKPSTSSLPASPPAAPKSPPSNKMASRIAQWEQ